MRAPLRRGSTTGTGALKDASRREVAAMLTPLAIDGDDRDCPDLL